jgi:hypothetical protein
MPAWRAGWRIDPQLWCLAFPALFVFLRALCFSFASFALLL